MKKQHWIGALVSSVATALVAAALVSTPAHASDEVIPQSFAGNGATDAGIARASSSPWDEPSLVYHNIPSAFGSATPGGVTEAIEIFSPDHASYGTMTINAPEGTRFESVETNSWGGSVAINAERTRATVKSEYGHAGRGGFGGYTGGKVWVKLRVPADRYLQSDGTVEVATSPEFGPQRYLASGMIGVDTRSVIPPISAEGRPGETVTVDLWDPNRKVDGTMIVTAPRGTTIEEVSTSGMTTPSSIEVSADKTRATITDGTFGTWGGATVHVSLAVPSDVPGGTRMEGGQVAIVDSREARRILSSGSIEVFTVPGAERRRLQSPENGATITPVTPFTGTGFPSDAVEVATEGAGGKVVGRSTVDATGQWSLQLSDPPVNGVHTVTVRVGGELVATNRYTMTQSSEPRRLLSPEDGTTITPATPFVGTGGSGESVTLTATEDESIVYGTTTVDKDGSWNLVIASTALYNVDMDLTVRVGGEAVANNTYTMSGAQEQPRALLGPADNSEISSETEFFGTAVPGDIVVFFDARELVRLATVEADRKGNWVTTLDKLPAEGEILVTAEARGGGTSTPLGTYTYTIAKPEISTDPLPWKGFDHEGIQRRAAVDAESAQEVASAQDAEPAQDVRVMTDPDEGLVAPEESVAAAEQGSD